MEAGEVGGKLSQEYGVGNSTISDIKKGTAKIRAFVAGQESKTLTKWCTMKTCTDADLDKNLTIWLPISGPLVQAKAMYYCCLRQAPPWG